jgi:chemotaxis protein methyltransferase CheR
MPATDYASNIMPLSEKTFNRFREFIHKELGIRMPDVKRTLLESRLQKRIRSTGCTSFEAYYDYVFSQEGLEKELVHMMDTITTNKTDFFREAKHFDYLLETALPAILATKRVEGHKKITCWSAGCSTGEEPYTLAMLLSDYTLNHRGVRFTILATDISTRVLGKAMLGIYREDQIEPVPMALRKRYLLRSREKDQQTVRFKPEIRSKIVFRRLNFMHSSYGVSETMDFIFCRNVLIYFDMPTQEKVINNLCQNLAPGGYLFTGHSETLHNMNVPLVQTGSSIYRRN